MLNSKYGGLNDNCCSFVASSSLLQGQTPMVMLTGTVHYQVQEPCFGIADTTLTGADCVVEWVREDCWLKVGDRSIQ